MAKTIFTSDITNGAAGRNEIFCIKEIQKHKTKTNDYYFRVVLQDKSGSVQGKIWSDSFLQTNADSLKAGDVISCDFEATDYKGELQVTIKKATITTEYNVADLVKMTTKDLDMMYKQVIEKLETIKDNDIRNICLRIAKDPELSEHLKMSPAAEKVHHDFVGGMLEHLLEMFAIAESLVQYYPEANRSIVMAGIFLHDIGKVEELSIQQTTIIRTIPGYLIGHIVIGIKLFERFLTPGFPENKKDAIEHIILSHHREQEFGAVVKPATIEAIIVAMADLASSVVRQYQKELKEGVSDVQGFGDYHKFLQLRIYHNSPTEEDVEAASLEQIISEVKKEDTSSVKSKEPSVTQPASMQGTLM